MLNSVQHLFFLLLLREILKQVQDDTLIMLNITAEARFKPCPARLSLRSRRVFCDTNGLFQTDLARVQGSAYDDSHHPLGFKFFQRRNLFRS